MGGGCNVMIAKERALCYNLFMYIVRLQIAVGSFDTDRNHVGKAEI